MTESRRTDVLGYLELLLSWKRFIVTSVVVVTLVAGVVSFLLPKWYRATASVLPPKTQDLMSGLSSAGSLLRGISSAGRLPSLSRGASGYNYLAILNSRTAFESVIREFHLLEVYHISDSSMEDAIKELTANVSFDIQENDNITIEVLDRDPRRAAAMANHFVKVLNDVSLELGSREARDNKAFLERRVASVYEESRIAEDSLRAFQERTGFLITPEQRDAVSSVAGLYAMKARKEIELAVLRRTTIGENPVAQQLEVELGELGRKLSTYPRSGIEGLRLYRQVAIQQKVLEVVVPMFEQARFEEQRDVPVVVVLDRAQVPEKKDRPKRLLVIGASGLTALLLSLIYVLAQERLRALTARYPDRMEQIALGFRIRRKG